MSFVYGLIASVSVTLIFACKYDTITIGIIANGTGLSETETFSSQGQDFVIVKNLVDTSEMFEIFRSVQKFNADKSVDVIVLLDYDITLLMIAHLIESKNKKLIKLGARDGQNMISEDASIFACNTNDHRCFYGGSKQQETYCLTDLNITNKNRDELIMKNPLPLAIRAIIKTLKWKRIFLFYESSKERELTFLIDALSKDGILFTMYNTDHVGDLLSVLESIYKLKGEAKKEIDVVIVCRFANTKRILKVANKFDSLNNEKTVLKMFSRWLIALYGYSHMAAKELGDCAKDLDNVAIIALPEQRNIYIQNVYDSIRSAALEIRRGNLDGKLQGDCKKEFVASFEKNAHSLNPVNLCQGYHIDTLLWTGKRGRQFSHVGYTDINGKIVLISDVFPNTRFGYNKRAFIVSTLEYSPFVIKRKVNDSYIYEGFCMDLLKELSHKLNFTYTLVEPEDRKWGSVINRVNITFNGLVGQLQREEVDIVASAISVQAERDPAMDFSYPYYYGYTTVLVKKPDVYATKWRTLIDPFKWEVLLTIGASLLVVTVLVFLLEKNNPFYAIPQYAEQREVNGGLHTWHSSFWYVFGALLCQGGVHLPESTAGRTLISCWWLTCIIIVGTYCGNLIAFLTVTKEKPPFNTLQEMIDLKGTYKWGTIGGTVWESMFPNSSNPTFRKMGEAFIEFNRSDPTVLHGNPAFHVQRVKKGKYAWIGDKTYMEIAMATECSLMTIKEEFMPLIYVLGFKNNSSHAAIFSEQIIKIHEGGLLQIWKRKWWPKSSFCAGNSITEAKPISLMDVQSAFYVCFVGVFFGVFAFLVEKAVHKYRTVFNK